jgi:hypothetical protein
MLLSSRSHCQILEHFDPLSSVVWQGIDTAWQIKDGRLQSNYLQPNSRFGLWAPAGVGLPAAWEWWMQLGFNTSSNNYVEVYLLSDSSDLASDHLTGCFVQIGNKDDEVCLYVKTAGNAPEKLINGQDGITGHSTTTLKVKVTCDDTGTWRLWTDTSGTGRYYVLQGTATAGPPVAAACFGILVKQSTPGFFQRHFFDDVTVTQLVKDTVAPAVKTVTVVNDHELLLQFTEPVDSASAQPPAHYRAGNNAGAPVSVQQAADGIHLYFAPAFPNGDTMYLQVQGITDLAGNAMPAITLPFLYYQPGRYGVLINEIFPDPEPAVGLPQPEFIELRNTAPHPVSLQGWRLAAGTGRAVLPFYQLPAGSLLVLCPRSKTTLFDSSINVLGLDDFPALGNDADTLVLYNAAGAVVHAVAYDKTWYAAAGKENGGWSLEMISAAAPCSGGLNWRAATAATGSTPGKLNSVATSGADTSLPDLLRAYMTDSLHATLYFSKAVDSLAAVDPAHYQLTPGPLHIVAATAVPPLFNTVQLQLPAPLQGIYTLRVKDITDCAGLPVSALDTAVLALPVMADSGMIVINELLFDPKPAAPEFIELYNRSARAVDLQQLYLAMVDRDGQPGAPVPLSKTPRLLLPGQYVALTRDPEALCRGYTCKAWENLLQVNNLPAFPNEGGTIGLYNTFNSTVDLFSYTPGMQLSLAGNTKGVSLERLSTAQPTGDDANWHPAAVTAGYATPGYVNSQQLNLQETAVGEVSLHPAVVSPDNDGMDDLAVITCRLPAPGYIGNITIFDAQGRPVRQLLQNGVLGNRNNIIWDGLGERKQPLPVGIYIVLTEVFDGQGHVKRWKLPVVVARRLN